MPLNKTQRVVSPLIEKKKMYSVEGKYIADERIYFWQKLSLPFTNVNIVYLANNHFALVIFPICVSMA